MKMKYEIAFWTWVCSAMLIIALAFSVKAFAQELPRTATFKCGGFNVTMQSNPANLWTASILPEKGVWVEVPDEQESLLRLINLDTQKLAVMGVDNSNQIFLQIFRNLDAYNIGRPLYSIKCRK